MNESGLPYSVIGTPRRMALTALLLAANANAPVSGVDSNVGKYVVADGSMLTVLHDQPMRLFLQARHEVGRAAAAAGSLVNVDVAVTGGGRVLTRTSRTGRAFPTLAHPDVVAYTQINGQPWTAARVMAVNWDTGVVTVETPSNANGVRVYYTFGDGEIALRAGRPYGSSSGYIQLARWSARGLHETDQIDRDAAPYATRRPMPIPQGFTLALAVRATSAVYFDGLAQHEISIPVSDTAVQVHNLAQLGSMAEMQLRGA